MISSHSRLSDWLRGVAGKVITIIVLGTFSTARHKSGEQIKALCITQVSLRIQWTKEPQLLWLLALNRLFHSAGEKAEEDNGKLLYKLNNLQNIFTIQHSAMLRFLVQWHHDRKQTQCLTWEHQNSTVDVVTVSSLALVVHWSWWSDLSVWWKRGRQIALETPFLSVLTRSSTVRRLTYVCS